jgi:pimeloyl-ACP methyl ester carboxylesterase
VTRILFYILLILTLFSASLCQAEIIRHDFHIAGDNGTTLFVREVRRADVKNGNPILLVHGARVPGLASFDLNVPNGSLAADLAEHHFFVYIMDIRGYGGSSRPPEMSQPPEQHAPLVRSDVAVRDIASAVEWIRKRTRQPRVALLGWATGGSWAGYYTALYSDRVSGLVMLNTLYGGSDQHPMLGHGTDMEDSHQPGHLNPAVGAYRLNTEASLFGVWDRSIPVENKSEWHDPAVAQAFAKAALESDPTTSSRTPPSFRSPNGALEDSFYQAIGRKLWDSSFILVPTLIIAGERDHSPRVKVLIIPGATHFVHLDRPERGRDLLISEIVSFLGNEK